MKKFLVICAVLISASAFISSCGDAKAKTYQCPMKCEGDAVTYDSAGKCPMCGMDLAELK
jgi:hypothetical protein